MYLQRFPVSFEKAKKQKAAQADDDDNEGNKAVEDKEAPKAEGSRKVFPARFVEPGLWRIKDAKWRVSILSFS